MEDYKINISTSFKYKVAPWFVEDWRYDDEITLYIMQGSRYILNLKIVEELSVKSLGVTPNVNLSTLEHFIVSIGNIFGISLTQQNSPFEQPTGVKNKQISILC